jgi:signal transduction histidine kinase
MENIRRGTAQMKELIDDLLAYARMEQRAVARSRVELAGFLDRVLNAQQAELSKVTLVRDIPNVVIAADPEGLALAVRNLIDNAIKFSSKQSTPSVEIRAAISDGCCRLSVRDNGVGFDMAYHEKVFEIFQRLHLPEDYGGTGIGLALVRKAMERMRGRVWAESRPNEGATFWLEFPLWTE